MHFEGVCFSAILDQCHVVSTIRIHKVNFLSTLSDELRFAVGMLLSIVKFPVRSGALGIKTPVTRPHYNDVIMGTIASQFTSLTIVYSIVFIQTQIKENSKAPRHWPLCGEFTGNRWIPRTNGQLRGKCFHLMTSSCLLRRELPYYLSYSRYM